MSKDIRSFFTVISKKSGSDSKPSTVSASKKNSKRLVDSDDEDVIDATPEPRPTKTKKTKVILSSDSEEEQTKNKTKSPKKTIKTPSKSKKSPLKVDTPKLKPIDIKEIFKSTPIKQSKVELVAKSPAPEKLKEKEVRKSKSRKGKNEKKTEVETHSDKDFQKTLMELDDDDLFANNLDVLDKTADEALLQIDEKEENLEDITEENPKQLDKKRLRTDSTGDKETPKKKAKIEHTDSGIDPGQEAHEKKRYSAMLYQKYLNRSGPKHHGEKKMPKGKPDCLKNICFLRTGVLDSLEKDEFDLLIKQHGGRTVQAISKKVNYVVVGDEPGPAKLAKAESLNIPQISEDELLDMILVKSGMEAKYTKKTVSEDLGVDMDTSGEFDCKLEPQNGNIDKSPQAKPSLKELNGKKAKPTDDNITNNFQKSQPTTSKEKRLLPPTKPQIDKPSSSKMSTVPQSLQVNENNLSLTEKYKPSDLKGIIGQQDPKSNVSKLKHWLQNWKRNQNPEVRKKLTKPSPWAKSDDGAYFKCALLSGPPGVGKTTTATLVAKDLGLDIVEFNASDTRSKRLLHDEVSQLLKTNTIAGFATGQSHVNKNRVLLMDEVDGMAGNEDRGGLQELIQLIKISNIPIICMCNDRNHQKMRSLVNYCYDLKFAKPKMEQIRGAMMSICFKEGLKITPSALGEIITGTGCDVRQTLNHLAILAAGDKNISAEDAEKEAKTAKKDTVLGPWEVCRAVFTQSEHKNMTLADKARLFFYDYSLGPLFVQENYLKAQPQGCSRKETLQRVSLAADSISVADLIDSKIRRTNNWSLLESEAFFASVIPGHYMSGHMAGQINFPEWLGKNSKKNKFQRMFSELQSHTRISTSASKLSIKLDYLLPLCKAILTPLKRGMDGVEDAIEVMKTYSLLREDLDNLIELCQWRRGGNQMSSIETKVKAAFTRSYNKQVTLPYAPASAVAKKRVAALEENLFGEEEDAVDSDNDDDDISKNTMIKVKTKADSKGSKDKSSTKGKKISEPASKKAEPKKGKGKKGK